MHLKSGGCCFVLLVAGYGVLSLLPSRLDECGSPIVVAVLLFRRLLAKDRKIVLRVHTHSGN